MCKHRREQVTYKLSHYWQRWLTASNPCSRKKNSLRFTLQAGANSSCSANIAAPLSCHTARTNQGPPRHIMINQGPSCHIIGTSYQGLQVLAKNVVLRSSTKMTHQQLRTRGQQRSTHRTPRRETKSELRPSLSLPVNAGFLGRLL